MGGAEYLCRRQSGVVLHGWHGRVCDWRCEYDLATRYLQSAATRHTSKFHGLTERNHAMRTLYVLMTGLAIAACSRQVPQGETIFVDGIRCVAFGNRAV